MKRVYLALCTAAAACGGTSPGAGTGIRVADNVVSIDPGVVVTRNGNVAAPDSLMLGGKAAAEYLLASAATGGGATVQGMGTAGTPSGGVLTVQGADGARPIAVMQSSPLLSYNCAAVDAENITTACPAPAGAGGLALYITDLKMFDDSGNNGRLELIAQPFGTTSCGASGKPVFFCPTLGTTGRTDCSMSYHTPWRVAAGSVLCLLGNSSYTPKQGGFISGYFAP